MKIPVLCGNCHGLTYCFRMDYGWATACNYCGHHEMKSDIIRMGKDEWR